ncbi:Cytoplasmic copper homeostasis protein cutC [Streptococcus sp. DD10]|uniref:copper homeostasis protein CutC n=1 Tax=Streptococcus sp. DD10 TaxID=1777878 RepID=UPI000794F922|nr:copper homeostasis protein CutC [Streptococcus sp. DD10]KXT77386.1 Cytoplasmic copper homeostasis protein cutC [Streptococcus sp. DD10]
MVYEFCAENITLLEQALQAGAKRIELCDNLAVGGTTPSVGVMTLAVKLCSQKDARVMAMIRPRGGDFVYSEDELEIMLTDIQEAEVTGCHGVVFGALTKDFELDKPVMQRLISASKNMEIVFHMAFDELSFEEQLSTIDWLVEHGVNRILTRAGKPTASIQERLRRYKELLTYANHRIEILAGGGINLENREQFLEVGLKQLHGTRVVF